MLLILDITQGKTKLKFSHNGKRLLIIERNTARKLGKSLSLSFPT